MSLLESTNPDTIKREEANIGSKEAGQWNQGILYVA